MLTKRIVRILTTESAARGRLTYEKELLDSKKNGHFPKTNHPGFASLRIREDEGGLRTAVSRETARKDKWQTDETNRGTFKPESAGGHRLAYEKESANSWKTSLSYKTNHPGFPAAVARATSVKWDILER